MERLLDTVLGVSAEAKKWEKAVEPVVAAYKEDLKSKGHKSDEIDGWIKYIRKHVALWAEKAKDQSIKSPY